RRLHPAGARRTMSGKASPFRIKRVYEPAADEDGCRVLVDRLWPRGLSKDKAHVDLWLKDVAPSDELRKQLHSDPRPPEDRWDDFVKAYDAELKAEAARAAAEELEALAKKGTVTLLYGAREETWNNAAALKAWLDGTRK